MDIITLEQDFSTLDEISNHYLVSRRYLKQKVKHLKGLYESLIYDDGYRHHVHQSLINKLSKRTYTRRIHNRKHISKYIDRIHEQELYKRMNIYCTISPRGIHKDRYKELDDMIRDIFEHLTHEEEGSHFLLYSQETNSNYYTVSGDRKKNVNYECLHAHFVCTVPVQDLKKLRTEMEDIVKTYLNDYEYDPLITIDLQRYDQSYGDRGLQYVLKNYQSSEEVLTSIILK